LDAAAHEITVALGDYFDGWYFADTDKLRRVFHPGCRLQCVIDEALDVDDMGKVYAGVERRESPAQRDEVRRDEILSIDVASAESALAKIRLAIGRKLFTDYLSLLKVDGGWMIVSKVFSFAALPDAEGRQP